MLITIGKRESKICATCQYWQGPEFVYSIGSASCPAKCEVSDEARFTYALCVKKHSKQPGTRSCMNHTYHYRYSSYL